jgi:glycosyltransferase involved in cell wall biosynthesis
MSLVSIVVPIYNIESFVTECIESIINQSYKNIEIILVDDGSTDNSGDICDKYVSIDNRIKVIHKKNGGLIHARKVGLELSTGEYILYIDGDDWIEKDLIQYYVTHINNADILIAPHMENLAGRIEILVNNIPSGFYNKNKLISEVYPKMMYNGKFSQFGIFSYVWGKLFRRNVLLPNQLKVDENIFIGEDAACLYPTLLDANSVVIIDQPYYHYRQRVDSLIKTKKDIEVIKIQTFYTYLKDIFKQKGVLDLMLSQLQFFTLSLLTVRSDGPSNTSTDLYPFKDVKIGDNIIICGGGTFGQHLYKKLLTTKTQNVVAWIDEWYDHYSKLGIPILGINHITSFKYDAVVIALIDEDISNQTYLKLIELGVDKNKIIQVSHYGETNVEKLLSEYKINL